MGRAFVMVVVFAACDGNSGLLVTPDTVSNSCLVLTPSVLDFGEVPNDEPRSLSFQFQNKTNAKLTVRVSAATAPFSFSGLAVDLPPRGSRSDTVGILLADALLHVGEIDLDAAPECHATLSLRALGKGKVLHEPEHPEKLDYGFLAPGGRKTLEVTFINQRREPFTLSDLHVNSTAYTVEAPSAVSVPPLSTLKIPITASPPDDLEYPATFVANGEDGSVHHVELFVVGGAPVAALRDPEVVIPTVGLAVPSFPPTFATRQLWLRNVTTQGRSSFASLRVVPPFFKVEPLGEGSPEEVELTFSDQVEQIGLPLGAEGPIELRVVPRSLGTRRYRVTFFTNAPVQPEVSMTLEATAQTWPECQLYASTQSLVLMRNSTGMATGQITFTNVGSTTCVLDDLRMENATTAFELTGVQPQVRLAPQEVHRVTVAAPVPTGAQAFGTLGFHVFNANSVRQFIRVMTPP